MSENDITLGYEEVYQERVEEIRKMIAFATLLDFLGEGLGDSSDYQRVVGAAYSIAKKANPAGVPTKVFPDATSVTSVIRSNVKIMLYNIIEFSVVNMIQAIYDRVEEEGCGYAEVSQKLRTIWHRAELRRALRDPSSNTETAERISKHLLDHAVTNAVVTLNPKKTIPGGNLDGDKILHLFEDHGVIVHADQGSYREDELKDIKKRRNDLAHGSVSFVEAGRQIATSELTEILGRVDCFLTQLRADVITFLGDGEYREGDVSTS